MESPALRRGVPGWEQRNDLEATIPGIIARIRSATGAELDGFILYCYGEPAAFFQLRLAGARWVGPVQNLGFADEAAPKPRLPTFLIFGRQARLTPGFAGELLDRTDRLRFVELDPFRSSKLVRLDDRIDDAAPRESVLKLYQFH